MTTEERSRHNARHLHNWIHLEACRRGSTRTKNRKKYDRKRQKIRDRKETDY